MSLFRREFGDEYEVGWSNSDRTTLRRNENLGCSFPASLGRTAATANQIDDYDHQRYH